MNGSCVSCGPGTYVGLRGCVACAAGRYNNDTGSTSSSACLACAEGQYQNRTGQASCILCDHAAPTLGNGANASSACLSMMVTMVGAGGASGHQGGWSYGADGGGGGLATGYVTAPLAVGTRFLVIAGERGTYAQLNYWGWGGGAPVSCSNSDNRYGGGGGGSSGIWLLPPDAHEETQQHALCSSQFPIEVQSDHQFDQPYPNGYPFEISCVSDSL